MSTKQKRNRPLWHHGMDMITMSGNGMNVHTHTRVVRESDAVMSVCVGLCERKKEMERQTEREIVCVVCARDIKMRQRDREIERKGEER